MTKIFIIEDEELIVRTYTTFLKSDYEVVGFAKSFDEALKKIEQNLPDIILCDIVIHGAKDGIDVCEKIQEKYDIPIIFISGYWDEKLFARAQKIRDCYYLLKPCKNQDIKNTIELAVNKKKSDNLLINSLLEGYVLTKIVYAEDNKIDDLTILNVNHQIEKITKLSKTEICGKSLKYLYPPDCADDIKFLFNQISNIKNINIKEEFIFSPLFQKKHYQISIYSPKEHYLVFLIKDISLEKEQEFELLNLYYIFNLIPTNIVITDTGGKIIYVNSAFENVTGYYFSEVVGKKTCILKSGLLEKNFYRNLWTTILEGKIWRGEFYNRKKNGELYWERATIFSREDALGEITHFIKISENITTEKQQILEIIEYKNFIENIIKSLTDILIVCDIHGKIIRINKTFEEILEYQESEIINNPIDIIMLEFKDKNLNKAANNLGVKINEYVILGALKNYHTKFITKSGGEIDVSLSSSVVYDDKKNIKAIIFIAHDIRRRLKQEREQQRFLTLEKKQKFILNNLYDAAKIILENLQLDFDKIANKIFKILTKLTDADSGFIAVKNEYNNYQVIFIELGKKQCKLNYQLPIHLKLKGLSQHINAAQRSFIINNFQNTEWQNIIPQGHIEIDNLLISPILYDGVIYGLVALANKSTDFIEDDLMITEAITNLLSLVLSDKLIREQLQKKEKEIIQKNEFLNMVLNIIPLPIFIKDKNLVYTFSNNEYKKFVNLSNDEILGKTIFDIAPIDTAEIINQMDLELLKNKNMIIKETSVKVKNELKNVIYYKTYFENNFGEPNILGVILDITSQKKLENELKTKQKILIQTTKMAALGELIAGIAHEINNPNNYISLNISALKRYFEMLLPLFLEFINQNQDLSNNSEYSEMINDIENLLNELKDGSDRIKRIVQDLKDFSKQTNVEFKMCSIEDIIMRAYKICKSALLRKVREVEFDILENLPEINIDPNKIIQVFINILNNAADAINEKPDGKILVVCRLLNQMIRVNFIDNGCGISVKNLKKIMEPFFTTKHSSGGTGIGLSIVYSIIKEHNASIVYLSDEGFGTNVFIDFPIGDNKIEQIIPKNILVEKDNKFINLILSNKEIFNLEIINDFEKLIFDDEFYNLIIINIDNLKSADIEQIIKLKQKYWWQKFLFYSAQESNDSVLSKYSIARKIILKNKVIDYIIEEFN